MMKEKGIGIKLLIIMVVMVFTCMSWLNCQAVRENIFQTLQVEEPSVIQADTVAAAKADSSAEIEPVPIEEEEDWNGLWAGALGNDSVNVEAQLDSAAQLLELAKNFQEVNELSKAQYFFDQARAQMLEIQVDSLNGYLDFYRELLEEISHFYDEYIAEADTLPAETPPEAIIAGVEEAQEESMVDEEAELFVPEMVIEASEVAEIMEEIDALPDIPLLSNKRVESAIRFFQTKGRKAFLKWMERGKVYIPVIKQILQAEGMPEDLVYLAMIESGFNRNAYSYAHAAGPWQFIQSTGKIFGLKIDYWYDERRDIVKSTRAASSYLRKLYGDFGDWYLALAAYNCGERRVQRNINYSGSRDFWKLRYLPRQTRNYVPTFIAAATIAKNPGKYGFPDLEYEEMPMMDSVLIRECLDMELIAELIEHDFDVIRDMNPAFLRWCTPPNHDSVWVYLPMGTGEKFQREMVNIPAEDKRSWVKHVVGYGENLSFIAKKYGTTVEAICRLKENKIHNPNRISKGKVLYIPIPSAKYASIVEVASDYNAPEYEELYYTVRKGDNLSKIAKRYHTTVSALRRWNNLYGSRYIYPGQKLKILLKEGWTNAGGNGEMPEYHIVKRGESLWLLGRKYGVPLKELMALNNLSGRAVIHPGDKIRLPSGASGKYQGAEITHIVKKGDTLWDIAILYGVSVSEIKRLNNISDHRRIMPGDKIRIPVSGEERTIHIIRKGDTLWDIALKYGVSIKSIQQANGISNLNLIRPGMKLIIPK